MNRWLRKKIHISWFIAWTSLGFLIGVALSIFSWSSIFTDATWLILSAAFLIIVTGKRVTFLVVLAASAGLILGLWRGGTEHQALKDYSPYYKQSVTLSGTVSEDISYSPQGDQRMRIDKVKINSRPLPEEVWVSSTSKLDIKRGDIVTLYGKLGPGFGNIPASMYYARLTKITRPYPGDIGRRVRDKFAEGVRTAIPEPEAGLGIGYLLGQSSSLPQELSNQFKTVGLTHAVVASGYNLTILVAFAARIFAKKSKYLTLLTSGAMISGFMLITGFSPSMSRAGLVSGLGLLAWYYGRKIHPFVLLPFAAAITVLLRPAYIWGDLGWYLSFSAFVGVIVLAPLLQHYFWGQAKKPHLLRSLLVDTVSAQLATAPIIILAFHQYSPYALLANLLILPLVPLAMLLTFTAGLAGLIAPGVASLIGTPAAIILQYSIQTVGYVANLHNSKLEVNFSVKVLVVCYIIVILAMVALLHKTKHKFREETLQN
jgi:competence protein ComEC